MLSASDFVGTWVADVRDLVDVLDPVDAADPARRQMALEHRSVERSIANLRTFPWIAARESTGALRLSGAWFDITLGELHGLTETGWEQLADA